jgi:hypothetical protein
VDLPIKVFFTAELIVISITEFFAVPVVDIVVILSILGVGGTEASLLWVIHPEMIRNATDKTMIR